MMWVKGLKTYRGREFTSSKFTNFCTGNGNGIRRQLPNPYLPEQIGVVERKNHTIMNMVQNIML